LASAAFLAQMPCSLWKALACRMVCMSSVMAMASSLLMIGLAPASWMALVSSYGVESPFLGFLALMGNSCRDSKLSFLQQACETRTAHARRTCAGAVVHGDPDGASEHLAQHSGLHLLQCESAAGRLLQVVF
jgi:hypothetical protein